MGIMPDATSYRVYVRFATFFPVRTDEAGVDPAAVGGDSIQIGKRN